MPRDSLAFAVRVGCQIDAVGTLHCFGNRIYMLAVTIDDVVLHGELLRRVDGAIFRNQVAHMPVRSQDLKITAQIFFEGFGLGG